MYSFTPDCAYMQENWREEVEKIALAHEGAAKWLDGKTIRKIIVVPGKIVNIVVG